MIIDFQNLKEESIQNFKGGEGQLIVRSFTDDNNKIMLCRLEPGSSIGLHTHETNCEIIHIIEGVATFITDDKIEIASKGQVHYCPKAHNHTMINKSEKDIIFYAIVH